MAEQGYIGRVLEERYEVRERIGAGGMATAYLAWDQRLACEVVVKIPHQALLADESFRTRFDREVQRLVQFRHAHVVGVIDLGVEGDVPFMVMEYLSGGSLDDRIEQGRQDLQTVGTWLPQIALALDFIHGDGFIHRDVKPGNILFDRSGHASLADFGLAKTLTAEETKLTATGAAPGSLAFMAPEALSGNSSPASDQYALASTVLNALTGEVPRPLEASVIVREELTFPLPPAALGALLKALARKSEDRFDSCGAFVAALVSESTPAEPAAPPVREEPELGDRLVAAWVESIRAAASSNGIKERTTFHRIPWFVVIGSADAGKSTLLTESGLDLRIAESGDHDLRSRWWVGKRGVFFETGASDPEAPEWQAFRSVFMNQRGGRKLDGVVVALSAATLIEKKEVGYLRRLIDDLGELSTRRFPVYVVVTQCDRIAGFADFFGALPDELRGECLGWAPSTDGSPYDPEKFAQEAGRMVEGLYRLRPRCLAESGPADPRSIFMLPEEFEQVVPSLKEAVDVLFRPDHRADPPVPGGVYFVGKPGGGSVIAPALDELSATFNLPPAASDTPVSSSTSSGFFHRNLLFSAILPRERKPVRISTVVSVAIVVLALLATALLTSSYLSHASELAAIEAALPAPGPALDLAHGLAEASAGIDLPTAALLPRVAEELGRFLADRSRHLTEAVVANLIEDCRTGLEAGILSGTNGEPDLLPYLELCEEALLISAVCEGGDGVVIGAEQAERWAAELRADGYLAEPGEAELAALFGNLQPSSGGDRSADDIARARAAILRHLEPIITEIEEWSHEAGKEQRARGEVLDQSVDRLVMVCQKLSGVAVDHERPERIVEAARELRSARLLQQSSSRPRFPSFARVRDLQDLSLVLSRAVDVIPVPEGAGLLTRVEVVLTELAILKADPDEDRVWWARYSALNEILAFLTEVIEFEGTDRSYSNVTTASLEKARTEIETIIGRLEEDAYTRLTPHFEALAGAPISITDEDGQLARQAGWWDVPVALLRARATDRYKEEYLEAGIIVALKGERFWKDRSSDREADVYTVARLQELILPRLRDQIHFFDDPCVAARIREDTQDALADALRKFLEETEEYWLHALERKLPGAPATSLRDIYEQLDLLTEPRSEVLRTVAKIQSALSGVSELKGPKDDPLLEATMSNRRRLFETFVICFDPEDGRVSHHMTLAEAGKSMEGLKRALEPLVAGLETPSGKAARKLFERQLTRSDPVFQRVHEDVRDLRRESANSRPARHLADLLEGILHNAWDALARLTADDLNQTWSRKSAGWRSEAKDLSAQSFIRLFGPESSELEKFLGEELDPLFVGPDRLPIETVGASLLVSSEFRAFLGTRSKVLSILRPDGAGFKADRISIDLSVVGENVTGVTAEYSAGERTLTSEEKRTDSVRVGFEFDWSPDDCTSLVFRVNLRDGSTRKLEWTGPWAVAEAFSTATRIEGNRYTWQREDEEVGSYAVSVDLGAGSRLLALYIVSGGRSPNEALLASLPEKIVELRKRRK